MHRPRHPHRSAQPRRAVALALAGLAALPVALTATAATASAAPAALLTPAARQGAARAGAAWLASKLTAGGFVGTAKDPKMPDYSATANAVVALASSGSGRAQARAALAYLQKHAGPAGQADGADSPGRLAALILAAKAMGANPSAFGGTGAGFDLVGRLLATRRTTAADAGLFGAQDPTYDGTYRQGLALAALAAAGRKDAAGVAWLQKQQCGDGSFMAYRADVSAPCPASDPANYSGPDTNATAMAVQGLVAQGVQPPASTLAWLTKARTADGGWPYYPGTGAVSDTSSTALVVQALLALKADASGGYAYLTAMQLGCAAGGDRGAFPFQPEQDGSKKANLLATLQVVPALAGTAFPVKATAVKPGFVLPRCAAA